MWAQIIIAVSGFVLLAGLGLIVGSMYLTRARDKEASLQKEQRSKTVRSLRHDIANEPEPVAPASAVQESLDSPALPTDETISFDDPMDATVASTVPSFPREVVPTAPEAPTSELAPLGERDEPTDETEMSRNRAILLVGIDAVPLPGPFWRSYSVKTGDDALGQLEQVRCDLIIVDFHQNASSVLAKVAKKYPYIPRLVRCNEEQGVNIRRLVPDAQDYVPIRCEDDEFFRLLERATALDLGELAERMQEKLGPVSTLPALPDNYQRIRQVINDPNGSARDVGNIVLQDIGLTTKVLQVVNSPLYGLRTPITDVVHAATLLGMRGIRDLTLTVEVFGFFSAKIPMGGITVEDLYNYSVKVAAVAQRIGRIHSDDAYTAALLHQIGRLILMTKLPEEYQDAIDLQQKNGGPLRDAQRAAIGIDQDETSAYLLSVWGLPQRVIEAVAFFDAPSLVPHTTLDVVDILHAAVALVSEHHGEDVLALDEMHLDTLGAADLIDEWREITLEIAPPPEPEEEEESEDEPSVS